MKTLVGIILFAALAAGQSAPLFQFNLDAVAAKASDHMDVSLNNATLQFAAKFLDPGDPDEAKIKTMISGLDGIYVRHFTFKAANSWSQADLDGIRNQLRAPEWSRIVGVKNDSNGENHEIYLRTVDKKLAGVAIISAEAQELTVVDIAGAIDLDSLAQLGGHFGIPKLPKK